MPEKVLRTFSVKYIQVMDNDGNADSNLMPKISNEQIKKIYELMIFLRLFDDTALKLQREGRMLTFASSLGQEAQVVTSFVLNKDDWVVPSFRENGVMMALGYPPEMLYQYWSGDERGMKIPKGIKTLPVSIPVGSQTCHGVGLAWAEKMKNTKNVVVSFCGDGGTSEGDFYEGLNFAGAFKVPLIHIVQNNQWAISVPRSKQTAAETLAQKAIACGFEGIQVDGNDVFAMYKAMTYAVEKARNGGGPTLIEMFTYRLESHTTADEWMKYRNPKEVEEWKKKDPIDRLEKYMMKTGLMDEDSKKKVWTDMKARVSEAVKKFEAIPPAKPEEMFDYIYEKLTPNLEEQKKLMVGG